MERAYTPKLYVRDLKKNVVTSVNPVGRCYGKKFIQGFLPNNGPGLRTIKLLICTVTASLIKKERLKFIYF